MSARLTRHAREVCQAKGFDPATVLAVAAKPDRVTQVRAHPGQQRHIGQGLAVILAGEAIVTVYLDGVITPRRPDQAGVDSKRLGRIENA